MTEEKVSPMSKGTGKRGDNLPRQESLLYSCRFAVIRQTVGKRLFMFQERNL